MEQSFSHFIPELAGSIISTILVSVGLFVLIGAWRWQRCGSCRLPFAIVGFSAKVQEKLNKKPWMLRWPAPTEFRECIETVRDLKANNAEAEYLKGLEGKSARWSAAPFSTNSELAAFVVSASLVLKLGIATVALVGSILLIQGSLEVITFFLFFLVVSRLYDPLQGALQTWRR